MRLRRLLLPALAALLATAGTLSAATPPQSPDAALRSASVSTHKYGSHVRQSVDVYANPSTTPRPALVLIHGGYWYQQTDWTSYAQKLSDEGFQVFAIEYRLNFEAAWPAQRDDVEAAVNWVRDNAAQFDADSDNVVMLGSSSGGQLATDAATHGTNDLDLKGVVALSPVASPYRAWVDGNTSSEFKVRKVRDNASILARCSPYSQDTDTSMHPSCWGTWRDMVSKNWANPGDAPMYLLHSDGDFVPPEHSTDLEATAEANGVPTSDISTHIVSGSTSHGAALLGESGIYTSVVDWLKNRAK